MDLIFLNDIEMIPSIGRERGLAYKLQIEDTSSLFSASFIPLFNLYISDRIVEYSDIFRNRHKSYIAKQYHGSFFVGKKMCKFKHLPIFFLSFFCRTERKNHAMDFIRFLELIRWSNP